MENQKKNGRSTYFNIREQKHKSFQDKNNEKLGQVLLGESKSIKNGIYINSIDQIPIVIHEN